MRNTLPEPVNPTLSETPPIGLNDPGIDPYMQEQWAADATARAEAADFGAYIMDLYSKNTGANLTVVPQWGSRRAPRWSPPRPAPHTRSARRAVGPADSGAFDVDVPHTDPVIATDPSPPTS